MVQDKTIESFYKTKKRNDAAAEVPEPDPLAFMFVETDLPEQDQPNSILGD
jgi:hypothetical protein